MEFVNGVVYKQIKSNSTYTFVLIYFNDDKWGMLRVCRGAMDGTSSPIFRYHNNKFQFTKEELIKYFDANNWEMLNGRLAIEEINGVYSSNNNLQTYTRPYIETYKISGFKPGDMVRIVKISNKGDEEFYKVGDVAKLIKLYSTGRWYADFSMNEEYMGNGTWFVSPEDFVVLNKEPVNNKEIIYEFSTKRKLII